MYAVGYDEPDVHKNVEVFGSNTRLWTSIADMHICFAEKSVILILNVSH